MRNPRGLGDVVQVWEADDVLRGCVIRACRMAKNGRRTLQPCLHSFTFDSFEERRCRGRHALRIFDVDSTMINHGSRTPIKEGCYNTRKEFRYVRCARQLGGREECRRCTYEFGGEKSSRVARIEWKKERKRGEKKSEFCSWTLFILPPPPPPRIAIVQQRSRDRQPLLVKL